LVKTVSTPIVLDADGINAYKECPGELKGHKSELLITPHKGEWSRLFLPLSGKPLEAVRALKAVAQDYGMTILFKGSPTIAADPEGRAYLLPYGNSGMATAGSGDVLSGIITSLIAQGCTLTNAAILGAFIHGKSGEAAGRELGEYSMIAGDIINHLSETIKSLA
jgi:NAD(P)H-hydrate epimerase